MSGTFEKWLQHRLNLGGAYPPLDEDGVVGRLTIRALKEFQVTRGLRVTGLADAATVNELRTVDGKDTPQRDVPKHTPPWYSLALTKMGLVETRDKKELSDFLKSDGAFLGDPSRLPWCGDFVETCIAVSLPREALPTNPYWALNWLKFGKSLPSDGFYQGAIAAFKREGGGHVGFVAGHDSNYVHVLGGNQSNSVSISRVAKSRLQGLRWPITYEEPSKNLLLATTTIQATITTNEA